MDKQRRDAYLKLIDDLVNCPVEKEIEIVTANLDLIDSGLLEIIEELAVQVELLGDRQTAIWLRDKAIQLESAKTKPLAAPPEVDRNFLLNVLTLVATDKVDEKEIFQFLESNLDKINNSFAQTLELFGNEILDRGDELEGIQSIAVTITNFSTLIEKLPLGNRATNVEISIVGHNIAEKILTPFTYPEEWSVVQNNLGVAYSDRIKGKRADNIEQAIRCYENALKVRNRQVNAFAWAETQTNLGNAYAQRINGYRADNLERAITYYQNALQVYTHQDFTQQWAIVQNNLSCTYRNRIRGNIAENMEACIMANEAALSVQRRDADPQAWAKGQHNLASAYLNRIYGNRALDLERAIYHSEMALQVRSYDKFPMDWADTKLNLAKIYYARIQGEKSDNLEQAIFYLQEALLVHTRETHPERWALIHADLGNVYCERVKGDRVENFDKAIAAFQSTLSIYTRELFPELWAIAQMDLGRIYFYRLGDNRAEEIEIAISYYQAALSVLSREAFPQKWADIQLNLGVAYDCRKQGDAIQNLEDSIAASQAALQVYTRETSPIIWAKLQNNLGNAYSRRGRGEKAKNFRLAVSYIQSGLDVYTRDAYPELWGILTLSLGDRYFELGQMDAAITCFRSALEIFTPISFPLYCLVAGYHLGKATFAARKWEEAIEGYTIAIESAEIRRSWFRTDRRRQQSVEQVYDFNMELVQACINCGRLDKAIEFVERVRSRYLVDLIASNDLYSQEVVSSEIQGYLQQYEKIQEEIDRLHSTRTQNQDIATNKSPSSLLTDIDTNPQTRAAWQAYNQTIKALEDQKSQFFENLRRIDPILTGQIQVNSLSLSNIQELIANKTTAILSFYSTYDDTYIFVVRKKQISCHICPHRGLEKLHDREVLDHWILPYIAAYDRAKTATKRKQIESAWIAQFNPFLARLSEHLSLDRLIKEHLNGIEEIIIIPYVNFHYIPFAALPLVDEQYLGDRFLIRYAPSCQILEFCQKRPQVKANLSYAIIDNATEDLPFSSFEGEQIAKLYAIPPHLHLKGRAEATVNNYRQIVQQVQGIINSHHAQSRTDRPLESKLQLGDGTITLGQLLMPSWRLPNLVDVFLSCCETGFGPNPITDDVLTISTGFLCAGARSVVSTLWVVDDLATALFSIFYHQYRQGGSCRPAALQQAQEKLRTLRGETLASVYQPQINSLLDETFRQFDRARQEAKANRDRYPKDTPDYFKWDEEYKQRFKTGDRIRRIKNHLKVMSQETFPFSHPFYWAAFICSGVR